MAKNVTGVFRTVKVVQPYREQVINNGNGGQTTLKSIMISVATDRDYKQKQEDGSMGYNSDFYVIKATGPVAESFSKWVAQTDANGKLISRRIEIVGYDETYQAERTIPADVMQVNINGQLYNINVPERKVKETRTTLIVDKYKFLDKNPANNNAQATAAPQAAQPIQATVAPVAAAPQQAVPVAAAPQQAVPIAAAPSADATPFN